MKKKINLNRYTSIYLLKEKRILKKDIKKYRRVGKFGQASKKYRRVGKFGQARRKKKIVYVEKTKTFTRSEKEERRYYRYSIAYYHTKYHKTFRAEIYTDHPINEEWARKSLNLALKDWVNKHPTTVQALFNDSSYIGFESDEIGVNDVGLSELNRTRCFLE